MSAKTDIIVIGGGIVGLSTAMRLRHHFPDRSVLLLEKEHELASHQSSRNSGVVHAGVCYEQNSLKAKLCRSGAYQLSLFCRENDLPFERRGKLIVASSQAEKRRLDDLFERCEQNGLAPRRLNQGELETIEPNIVGEQAILIRSSAITDYRAIAETMAAKFTANGGVIERNCQVESISESDRGVYIEAGDRWFLGDRLVSCGGLMADRLAAMCSLNIDFTIVPFRGEYYQLPEAKNDLVNHMIYPVPDPSVPFLGVHLTPNLDGRVTVGPNAVLAFAREGYKKRSFSPRDFVDMARYSGTRKLLKKHWRTATGEMRDSTFRRRYLVQCRRYCPSLTLQDLQPYSSGVRAQGVFADGTMIEDFFIGNTKRTIHVCYAPSPAASSSLALADYLSGKVSHVFDWPRSTR